MKNDIRKPNPCKIRKITTVQTYKDALEYVEKQKGV